MGAWLKGHRGPFTELRQEHLDEADNTDILTRWLTVMKSSLLREEHFADALRCSDMALEFSLAIRMKLEIVVIFTSS